MEGVGHILSKHDLQVYLLLREALLRKKCFLWGITEPSNGDCDNGVSDNCDHNFGTFDDFGVKNDQKVSHNMILMSKYKGQHGGKRVKKFGQGFPPPLFGQCPKENIFSLRRASLSSNNNQPKHENFAEQIAAKQTKCRISPRATLENSGMLLDCLIIIRAQGENTVSYSSCLLFAVCSTLFRTQALPN